MKTITHADRLAANIVVAQKLGIKQEYYELARDLMKRKEILTAENYKAFKAAAIQARKDWEAAGLMDLAKEIDLQLIIDYASAALPMETKFDLTDKDLMRLEIDVDERSTLCYMHIIISSLMDDESPGEMFLKKEDAFKLKQYFEQLEIV